jgi:hypothetical protein
MPQVNKNERYYRDLVTDFNRCLTDADLEAAFQRVKEYVFKNFAQPDAERKNSEIINYQASFSRVSKHRRVGEIGFTEFNQEVSKITLNIQEFVQTLKPEGVEIDSNSLLATEVMNNVWNYEDNMITTLVFQDGFSLLDAVFDKFKVSYRDKSMVRVDKYFFNGTRKILIDDGHFSSLEESELKEVVFEAMDWSDALIIQKKNKNGFVLSEGLVFKSQEKEEVIIRTNGEDLYARSGLMREVIDWFRKKTYPESMKEPFHVKVHYSGLDIFHYFEHQ